MLKIPERDQVAPFLYLTVAAMVKKINPTKLMWRCTSGHFVDVTHGLATIATCLRCVIRAFSLPLRFFPIHLD